MKLQRKPWVICDSVPDQQDKRRVSRFLYWRALHRSSSFLSPHWPCSLLSLGVGSVNVKHVFVSPSSPARKWHKSWCKAGSRWVCSARTCSVTDQEHSHCSGVSPARANKMLLPRAFHSCKNRSSRNAGCQQHTQASKQLVDVHGRVRKYPEKQGQ